MKQVKSKIKVEYGDFQTPLELANNICKKLFKLGIKPNVIIEPTCGLGNFINAARTVFYSSEKIIGIEVNELYLQKINKNQEIVDDQRIQIYHRDFFDFDWLSLIDNCQGEILVLGNFPWVTNSQQGLIGGVNLPQKSNFQKHSGLDAITGKSNFDISEWMLIKTVDWIHKYNGCIAMLCKTSVARKLLNYIHSQNLNLAYFSLYKVDAKKYFNATVDAGLLLCKFESGSQNYFCDVFESLESSNYFRAGYHGKTLVRDIKSFQKVSSLFTSSNQIKWRSGIKHDCSNVMEFNKVEGKLINGFGEIVDIEDTYIYPLLKGSDIAKEKVNSSEKYILIPQKSIGEPTEYIKKSSPNTWNYLEKNSIYLDYRKSKIYKNNPRFSIFGVGDYTFKPWKIAICGLYKKLSFKLVGMIDGKPTVFDDTVYFLGFDNEQVAQEKLTILTSQIATTFYSSLIFWDDKRPIKSSILNHLDLKKLERSLDCLSNSNFDESSILKTNSEYQQMSIF